MLIPQKMRDKAKEMKCAQEVTGNSNVFQRYYTYSNMLCNTVVYVFISIDFSNCCKDSSFLMVVKCREQNAALKSCLMKWFTDEKFKEECTQEYLEERSQYRRTGIPVKSRRTRLPTA